VNIPDGVVLPSTRKDGLEGYTRKRSLPTPPPLAISGFVNASLSSVVVIIIMA